MIGRRHVVLALASLAGSPLVGAGSLLAQTAEPRGGSRSVIDALRERTNAGTVGIISGGINGTYVRIAAELASVLDDGDTLRVLPIVGKGSLQNIADILFLKGVDIGIVQSDVLAYIKRERLYPGVDKSIQYVAKLYNEELHILAGKDTSAIADLAGKKVNVDSKGSGTAMTASLIFDRLGIKIEPSYEDQAAALDKLRRGEIAALCYVAGKPASLFRDAKAEEGLHFLAVPEDPTLLETYFPAGFSHADYPGLIAEGETVPTLAVGSVMAVYDWQVGSVRYRKVARFVDAFMSRFPAFLEPSRHPKWREVNLAAQVPGWTRFAAAQDWLKREAMAPGGEGTLHRDFMSFLDQSGQAGGSSAPGAASQREALFQEFMQWLNRRR